MKNSQSGSKRTEQLTSRKRRQEKPSAKSSEEKPSLFQRLAQNFSKSSFTNVPNPQGLGKAFLGLFTSRQGRSTGERKASVTAMKGREDSSPSEEEELEEEPE